MQSQLVVTRGPTVLLEPASAVEAAELSEALSEISGQLDDGHARGGRHVSVPSTCSLVM